MNEKCTTDQDNGMAERHKEQPDVNDLIHNHSQKKANHTLQTMRLQHLRLCTAANIRELVNDGPNEAASDRSLVWPAADRCRWGGWWMGWWTKNKFLGLDTSLRICYNVWSSTFSVNILTLNCWNFCVWRCVSYHCALANALMEKPKLVLCFTA